MSDLIYKQNAIDLVKGVCDAIMSGCNSHYDSETGDKVYDDIFEVDAILKCNKEIRIALRNLPSAEPKIIHCKDCIWHNKNINQCDRQVCAVMYADDFCSYGERRGEQDDT